MQKKKERTKKVPSVQKENDNCTIVNGENDSRYEKKKSKGGNLFFSLLFLIMDQPISLPDRRMSYDAFQAYTASMNIPTEVVDVKATFQ
jgi:hypothetical protein